MFGTFVRDQVVELASIGVDVRVCVPESRIIFPFCLLWRYSKTIEGKDFKDQLPTQRVPWYTLPRRFLEARVRKTAWRQLQKASYQLFHEKKPDLVHAHDLFPDGYASVGLAKAMGAPLIVTSHGGDNRVHVKMRSRRSAVLEAASAAARVVCVSNIVKSELALAGLQTEKMLTIRNGIDANRKYCGPKIDLIRGQYPGKTIILSVGHMVHYVKGFDITIKAFSRITSSGAKNNVVLLLIGDGHERASLERLAGKSFDPGAIHFLGAKSPSETMEYMAACDIFCLPSWYEAFGVVYLEAMLHSKPVIGVAGQGISEVVTHQNEGLLVPPKDVDATQQALMSLINNEEQRLMMGKRGHSLVENTCTQRKAAEKLLETYNQVLNK